jgi:hypothetical protein
MVKAILGSTQGRRVHGRREGPRAYPSRPKVTSPCQVNLRQSFQQGVLLAGGLWFQTKTPMLSRYVGKVLTGTGNRLMSGAHDILFVPTQFPTIQAAVNAIERATTIVVEPGAYDESVVVTDKQYVVIESVRLSRRGVTVAGGEGSGVFQVHRSTLHLSGIEVRSTGRLRGLWISDSTVTLQDCIVAGNGTCTRDFPDGFGAGMECRGSTVRIQKTTIAGNTVDQCTGAAAALLAGARTPVTGSAAVAGGKAPSGPGMSDPVAGLALGGGLYFENCKVEIAGSTIQANSVYSAVRAAGGGIWFEGGRMRVWRSRVTDNALRAPICEGGGIYLKHSDRVELGGSVITGNGFAEGVGGGIFIEGDPARVAIHGNTSVRQNHPDDLFPPR